MHLRFSDDELATLVEMVSLATEMAALNPNDTGQAGYARFEGIENKVLEAAKSTGLQTLSNLTWSVGKIASPKNSRRTLTSKNVSMRSGTQSFANVRIIPPLNDSKPTFDGIILSRSFPVM